MIFYQNLKIAIIVVIVLFIGFRGSSQENISWDLLADVVWHEEEDTTTGYKNTVGEFGNYLKQFNGKEVYISGYVIPLDAMGMSYALSRSSYASCFFCGQAGPETVMELKVRPRAIESHDQNNTLLKFKGTLVLKEINPTGLNYILDRAILIR
jgi:uncharacterized membrane protein YcgQ (UPF0703/DUF1980 family)